MSINLLVAARFDAPLGKTGYLDTSVVTDRWPPTHEDILEIRQKLRDAAALPPETTVIILNIIRLADSPDPQGSAE